MPLPPGPGLGVEISCRVYNPRRPRESPLFRLVEQHLEELLRAWPARFVRQHGPLRAVVERVLREFLRCGLLESGFARLWCGECRRSVLVAFSCRGRSFCPSCEKKRQICGPNGYAKATITHLLDQFGFDTVDAGPLKEGWRIQRDTLGLRPAPHGEQLRRDLAAARRYADR